MDEIQRARPGARTKALAIVVACAIVGGAVLLVLQRERDGLVAWLMAHPSEGKTAMLVALVLGGCVPLITAAMWTWRLGNRVLRDGRFPPEGVDVVRDTPILRGAAARGRGRTLQGLGALLLLAGGAMLWLGVRLSSLSSPE